MADCKSTRRSMSSGLNACGMYLYRLCKFLCKDDVEMNNDMVQQRLYTDSSSAPALVQRAGTGRLKHVQIKQFYLQTFLRAGIFTIHKMNTKLSPGDLNTKRFSGERRKFLSRLIGLFMADSYEENDDSELRRVGRINRVSRQQCVRLIQMATATLNVCFQLKGWSPDVSLDAGDQNFKLYDGGATAAMVMEAVLEWTAGFTYRCAMVVGTSLHYGIYIGGSLVVLALVMFVVMGPVTWRNSRMTRWFEI